MKKEELKRDPVAEKLISAVEYTKNNISKIIGLVIIILILVTSFGYYQNSKSELSFESKLAVDEIMLQLVNEGLNNPDYFDETLNIQIDSIYQKYPNSKHINYLAFIVHAQSSDSRKTNIIDKINIAKNKIENSWFKSQANFVAGDYYADNNKYDEAIKNFKEAIKHADSNAQKAYGSYKVAIIYFEKNEYKNAYKYHEEAKMLFDLSKENPALSRNQQFSSWVERNTVAMAKVENLLKK